MLVTTLGAGDYIMLDENIVVHFDHKIDKNNLAIAVEAPKNISVLRKKLIEKGAVPQPRQNGQDAAASRLLVTLNANEDYIMIGDDITVKYKGNKGHSFSIGIGAPKNVKITRSTTHTAEVEKAAQTGDYEAQIIAELLAAQNEKRREISQQRKEKQQKYTSLRA